MIRKKNVFLIFIIFFFFPLLLLSQTAPPIQWQNTIGGTKGEELAKIFVNNIGNYIIGGSYIRKLTFEGRFPPRWDCHGRVLSYRHCERAN